MPPTVKTGIRKRRKHGGQLASFQINREIARGGA